MEVSFHPSKLGSPSGLLVDINTVKLFMTLGLITKSRYKSNRHQLLFLRNEMHFMFFPPISHLLTVPDGPPMLTPPSLLSCVLSCTFCKLSVSWTVLVLRSDPVNVNT